MNIKGYLNQAYTITQRIKKDEQRLKSAMEKATDISAKIGDERVQTSSAQTSTMSIMASLAVDLERDIKEQNKILLEVKKKIEDTIDTLDDYDIKLILKLRYLCFFSWEDIADQLYFSESKVYRLHRKGLEILTVGDSR